jgi:Flp pilus assembly protein TadD
MSVYPLPIHMAPAEHLLRRALRLRRRGEARRALVAFREACAYDDGSPKAWTFYGVLCAELGRRDEAESAFRRALWLRKQARQTRRMDVLHSLMERLGLGRQCA